MSTVVSGGRHASAMTPQLSKPTMAMSSRHPQAGLTKPVGDTAGDLVAAAEHGVKSGAVAQQHVHPRRPHPSVHSPYRT